MIVITTPTGDIGHRVLDNILKTAEGEHIRVIIRDPAALPVVAATLLLDDSWSGQEDVPALGPEDLSNNDMAQIISEALAKPMTFQQIPGAAYKARFPDSECPTPWPKQCSTWRLPRTTASTTL